MTAKHDKLRRTWEHHNKEDFGGLLSPPKFSVGRRERLVEGAFTYTNVGGNKKLMIKGEMFGKPSQFLAVVLHEMIHQWELEVVGVCPQTADHKGAFAIKAEELTKKYGVPIL